MQPNEVPLASKPPQQSDQVRTTTYIQISDRDTDLEVESASEPQAPPHVSRFVIRRHLGEGGFGSVYLAYDPTLDREIALKLPSRQRAWTKEREQAFLDEARIAARLKHPHVAAVYDAGSSDEAGVFIAMEYVAGQSLAQRLRRGKLTVTEATRICGQIAQAMHYGHKLGLVHRDLKPSNILLDESGNVKVCDFGLALREEQQPYLRGDTSGTLSYMSPEQVRGESHHLDGRTDIWSLGVILYECLAGRRPFRGDTNDELRDEILTRDPKPLRQLDDSIPPALDELCLKCLMRSPAERLPTALDFQQALAERPSAPKRTLSIKVLLSAVAAVLLVAVTAIGGPVVWRLIASHSGGLPIAESQGSRNLLETQPDVVFFAPAGGQNTWSHMRGMGRLMVDSHHWSLFSFGAFAGKAKLDVSARAETKPSLCGAFWGLHLEPAPDGTAEEVCLVVVVEPSRPGQGIDKSAMVRLYRFHVHRDENSNPAIRTLHHFGGIPLTVDWTRPIGLQLDIINGELAALYVQDHTLENPLALFRPNVNPDWAKFSSGRCGLVAWNGKVSFIRALLTSP